MWGFGGALRALGNDMGFVKLVIAGSIAIVAATRPNTVREIVFVLIPTVGAVGVALTVLSRS